MLTTQACHWSDDQGSITISWRQLPQIPDSAGFAGAFAGVSSGHLLVGGGSNFPEGTRPWSGGTKVWNDKVFALAESSQEWKEVGKLPRPMGYSVSLTWENSVVILGGADQQQHYSDAYLLSYTENGLVLDTLPSLPEPNANACGALIGDVVYVAGGLDAPTATAAKRTFWSLDLGKSASERRWEVLEPWPGEARMLSVGGSLDGAFYLMSGVALETATDNSLPQRKYLRDAFRYQPGKGWEQIADLPHAAAAAPTPAYASEGQLLVFGGDDGSLAGKNNELKDKHPGFRTGIQAYHAGTKIWENAGEIPTDKQPDPENNPNASTWAPVTTTSVIWSGEVVLPMGEVRPGVRTNRVLAAKPSK
jgi:Uncharacterized protein conserved in bacteria